MILGIDPGLGGALALYNPAGDTLCVHDMPTTTRRGKRVVDEYELARIVDAWARQIKQAWLEMATPRPGTGVGILATSLRNYGLIRGVIVANFIPLHDVPPATWKRAMGVTKDKATSRAKACELLPEHAPLFRRVKDSDRAEAALIALYGARQSITPQGAE